MPDSLPYALFAAVALALVHLYARQLRFLKITPRSIWLSMAGGVSVAYIFVHVLPELGAGQVAVREAVDEPLGFVEHHVYLMALLGLSVYYGVERAAIVSRTHSRKQGGDDVPANGIFWLHVGSFSVYNGLIGYLLQREQRGWPGLLLFACAMALHFVVNDFGLREHYRRLYDRIGRWLLALAILFGWGMGAVTEIGEAAIAVVFAFLAGGVMLNVLKEELPEERESRFWAFAVGAAAYAILLLLL